MCEEEDKEINKSVCIRKGPGGIEVEISSSDSEDTLDDIIEKAESLTKRLG
jgi:hypothetical protein